MAKRDGKSVPYFPLKINQCGTEWKVANPVDLETFWLNDYGHYLLKLCDGYKTYDEITQLISEQYDISLEACKKSIDSILNPMTRADLVWWRQERMRWIPTPPPQSIFWELTWDCNLKCLHCVVSAGKKASGELTLNECRRLADELASLGVKVVAFSGGEPMLRKDFFEIAEYVTKLGIVSQVATTGTLIGEAAARRLKSLNCTVQITLYGASPELHDRFCNTPNAFSKSVRAVTLLKQAGVSVTVATVATKYNSYDIPEILEMAARLGADAFRLIPFIPSGRGIQYREMELEPAEMRKITTFLRTQRGTGKINVLPMEFEHTFAASPKGLVDSKTRIGCDGAIGYCTIGATGEVLPCSFFSGVEVESVKEKPFWWIWTHSRFLNYFRDIQIADIKGACRTCQWLSVCRAGCRAANRAHGDLFGTNRHCWVACGTTNGTSPSQARLHTVAD